VAERRFDVLVLDAPPRLLARPHKLLALPGRVQPVAGEGNDQEIRPRPFNRRTQRAVVRADVEVVNGFGDDQIAVGVEAADELLALVGQVAFDGKLRPVQPVGQRRAALQAPSELLLHRGLAHVGDVGHHARQGQPGLWPGAVVVVAVLPMRVGVDRLAACLVEGDLLGSGAVRAGQEEHRLDALWVGDGPLQRLHRAHAAPRHGEQAGDAQPVEQVTLRLDHIGDGDQREACPIRPAIRRERRGAGAALAAADHVGAEHEVTVGVEQLARPDGFIPPARLLVRIVRVRAGGVGVAGEGVADQDGVGAVGVERPVGLVGQGEGGQRLAAAQPQRNVKVRELALHPPHRSGTHQGPADDRRLPARGGRRCGRWSLQLVHGAHLLPLYWPLTARAVMPWAAASAWSRSARMSSMSSMPTASRM